ncbi:hypothetical protein [Mitsuokella multacida]
MSILDWFDQDKLDAAQFKRDAKRRQAEEAERRIKGLEPTYGPTPGSGNGGATKIALLNMLSTSDLDQVLADCAPALTQKIYKMAAQADFLQDQCKELKDYDELKGRYAELQQHYAELQDEYKKLVETLAASAGKQDARQ